MILEAVKIDQKMKTPQRVLYLFRFIVLIVVAAVFSEPTFGQDGCNNFNEPPMGIPFCQCTDCFQ